MCMCFATPEEKAALKAAQQHFGSNQIYATPGLSTTAPQNQPVNGLIMNQTPTSYDSISAIVLFGGLLLIAVAVYHMAQKNKKQEKEENAFTNNENVYDLLQEA